ncbi:Signal transduction histidine kinase [Nakamurella panacisegetis]|uniref:histidine kinase n=1 Tax=Nakamurella panacisegetis TaxID=1090615 RepID=A0A1H0LV47_9ACTN|nr:histidine kinase [Nakamurella panacisegetis]SDO71983.1 Signal transduction histidine kinase [Nakamurella panacisegetis]
MTTVTNPAGEPVAVTPARNRTQDLIQRAGSATILVASWLWLGHLGFTGVDGLALALLVVNSVLILLRHVPAGVLGHRNELLLVCTWGLAAAALLSIRSLGTGAAFGYLAAGLAGYRLPTNEALPVAVGIGVLSAVGLNIAQANGIPGWPWLLGLTVSLPVFLGMANRSRDVAMASALEAARSARRAAESEAQARTLAERARISRDIHDVLAHSLSGVSMQLELSEMLLAEGEPARARESIARAHSMVREGMAEARRAVTAMRAEVLPLEETLAAQFLGVAELQVTGEARELPTNVTQALIRAAQEALTNARRHAPGAPLAVRLTYVPHGIRLEILNGAAPSGPVRAASPGSGMGLVGMRERTALLGGFVDAGPITESALAGGWQVTVEVPTEGNSE